MLCGYLPRRLAYNRVPLTSTYISTMYVLIHRRHFRAAGGSLRYIEQLAASRSAGTYHPTCILHAFLQFNYRFAGTTLVGPGFTKPCASHRCPRHEVLWVAVRHPIPRHASMRVSACYRVASRMKCHHKVQAPR